MFEQAFKKIDDILRKDAGVSSELDYIEQTSWLLFLKYLDALEQDRAQIAELHGQPHTFLLEKPYRWHSWATPLTASGALTTTAPSSEMTSATSLTRSSSPI